MAYGLIQMYVDQTTERVPYIMLYGLIPMYVDQTTERVPYSMAYGLIQMYVDQTTERVPYHHGIWADTDVRRSNYRNSAIS